ncbi:hypothetical protein GCM10022289_33590 [Pedobacter jeongneungensis]|uniref:DUF4302 domain-containing protein n=1 Tax=Pedobacter jeongneungensis TaxID=947309 RepID=A0ABP8BK71_9SPHI
MKHKLLYVMLVVTVFITGCKKDSDPVFDDPDARLIAELAADQAKLLASVNGWKATIYPKGGKGYSYYLKFDASGKISMLSDFNATSATTLKESTYRLKALQFPTLIFDTYSYIHLAADPDASVSGGTSATGLKSDFEFAFDKASGDSLKMNGIFNGNAMTMIKLSEAESASIVAGGLKTMMDANAAYVTANRYPYIIFADNIKVAISIDPATKVVKLSYINGTEVKTQSVTFAHGINKLTLSGNLTYNGITFNELQYDPTNKVYYITAGSTRYMLQNSATPITPLSLMFGFPSSYTYRRITIPSAGLTSGVTSGFSSVYNSMVANFASSGRVITSTFMSLTGNDAFHVEVAYTSGTSAFIAAADYTYTRVGDVFTLSAPVYNGNWTTRATQLLPLTNYMLTGPFKIDWVTSTNPNSPLLGGFYRTADSSSFIYGAL